MAFENWFIEFTEPGPGTHTAVASTVASNAAISSSGAASSTQTRITVTPADLANLQAQLFAAVAAEAGARSGADASEIVTRTAVDSTLFDLCAALHAADTQIYSIVINGTGPGGGPDNDILALQAWTLAQIGTNTSTAALNLAAAAQSLATAGSNLAWEAFVMAGTSTGSPTGDNGAFALAVRGTNIANEALGIAIIGTNQAALDTNWIGTINTEVGLHTNWIGTLSTEVNLHTNWIGTINTEVGLNTTWIGTVTTVANSGSQLAVLLYNWFGTTHGIPTGGSTGQVLTKNSGSNYDVIWATPTSGTSSGTSSGTTIFQINTTTTVTDVLQVQVFS